MSAEMTPADAELAAALAAKSHAIRIKPGLKEPVGFAWNHQPALTPDSASAHVAAGGNIGVDPGRSRMVLLDAEDALGTAWVRSLGFEPTVITAKSGAGPVLADGKENTKAGGSHTWLQLSEDAPADLGNTSSAIALPNGGRLEVFAAAGVRHVMVPPSRLDEAGGRAYVFTGSDIAVAQAWLWDRTVPYPDGAELLHGVIAPQTPREKLEQSARSMELSDQIDSISWDQWLAADHRLTPTDEVDGCGCPVWHWKGADHDKSVTLHDGCAVGNGAHIWSNTMIAELGLNGDHVSRLDLACALRTQSRSEVAASVGIQLGEEHEELGSLRPRDYERIAAHFEKLGETARAAMYRGAAAVMASAMPTPEQRGETFTSGQVLGAPAPTPRSEEDGEQADGPVAPVIPIWTGSVPPAFGGPAAEVAYTRAPDPGPFPIDALPKVLRDHAAWVMHAINIPASMVGPMYLPVLSAACNRAVIIPRAGYTEKGCPLWVIIIAPPSSRKSPVLALVVAPLDSAQKLLKERTESARAMSQLDAEALEDAMGEAKRKYRDAIKAAHAAVSAPVDPKAAPAPAPGLPPVIDNMKASVATDRDVDALRSEYEQLQRKAREARDDVPGKAVLSFEDATDAAMQDLMAACGGYGFLIATEASSWFNAMVREDSSHITPGNYLKAYSNEAFKTFRVGRGEIWIDEPFLPMLHIIQPDPLRAALKPDRDGHNRLIGNGAWARFGVSYVEDVDPDEWDKPIPDGGEVTAAYTRLVEHEFLRSYGRVEPLRFGLSAEANLLMGAIYNRVERIIAGQRHLPSGVGMAEEWGKACGRMLRIARVFRQLELSDEEIGDATRTHLIGLTNLRDAWRITEWMMGSQAYAMGGAKADGDGDLAAKCATWLRKRLAADGAVAYRTLRDNRTHRPYLDRVLDEMVEAGEVAMDPGPRSNATVTPTENLASAA
ncbi:hypothetical protein A5666_00075 [Mycolicibacterium fortuitum]|uniref:DUF3987 domain-containing protein n=1 Tax=Mycolicibacterium fortuitum TaxID=1766 RepID=UPI0007E96ADD|nr:DUF3987 domain-containing protein [Mycolicibacterium fortuitum]OBA92974.1 hypothetical protein A5665_10715 [Mycolicibacterium fortuitum]OBI66923.1 hypothetical protein A5666_00075 [Mycolicibacterium fortuitum]